MPGNWFFLSIYHFNMIYDYALLALATTFYPLATQTHYFHSWLMASFRLLILAVTVALMGYIMSFRTKPGFPVFPSVEQAELIASFDNQSSRSNDTLLAVVEKREENLELQHISWIMCRAVVIFNSLVALYAISMMLFLRRWMINDSGLLNDGETEQEMSFGQAVPVALMVFAPLNAGLRAVSDYRRKRVVHVPADHHGSGRASPPPKHDYDSSGGIEMAPLEPPLPHYHRPRPHHSYTV
ncbi:hypothetical protein MN608_04368 [Microdochium nivale]|nr:hypothetical protein MN608_04368 [Microdochium nivale]